jgi:hypothetical protein
MLAETRVKSAENALLFLLFLFSRSHFSSSYDFYASFALLMSDLTVAAEEKTATNHIFSNLKHARRVWTFTGAKEDPTRSTFAGPGITTAAAQLIVIF